MGAVPIASVPAFQEPISIGTGPGKRWSTVKERRKRERGEDEDGVPSVSYSFLRGCPEDRDPEIALYASHELSVACDPFGSIGLGRVSEGSAAERR